MLLERRTAGLRTRLAAAARLSLRTVGALGVTSTFVAVTLAWAFFRAASLPDALYVLSNMPRGRAWQLGSPDNLRATLAALGQRNLVLGLAGIVALVALEHLPKPEFTRPMRWGACYALVLVLVLFGVYEDQTFIYFQF
jgi:hypothetical protein